MRPIGRVIGAVTVACLVASAAGAQTQSRSRAPKGPQFNANVYGGYDAPLFATSTAASLQPAGQTFAGMDGDVSYGRAGRRVSIGLSANASNRYYPQFTPAWTPSYGAGLSLASVSRGKWGWSLSNFAQYAPITATSLFAGASGATAQSFTLASGSAFQLSTIRQVDVNSVATVSYSLSRRTHVFVTGGGGTIVPIDSAATRNIRLTGSTRLARDITRNLRLFVGYNVTQNRVPARTGAPASTTSIGGVDFGVDFSRPFQITRNTTLGFQSGLLKVPDQGGKSYQLTGNATLDHTFLTTWSAQLAVSRDARYVQSFKDPVVLAAVSASVGGTLVGRLGASLSGNYSDGTINSPGSKAGFTAYSAAAQLRYDIKQLIAAFVEYSAFRSEVDTTSALTGYPTGAFGRYSVRGGLSLGLSPFRK